MCSLVLEHNFLYRSLRPRLLLVFKFSVSLLVFCLFAMSVTEKGVFKSTLIVNWFISPCNDTNFYLVYFGAMLLGNSYLPHELNLCLFLRISSQCSQEMTWVWGV